MRIIIIIIIINRYHLYDCMPETNHVSRIYVTAFILFLQFMVHVMLFPILNVLYCYISIFESCVQCPIGLWVFL
jgi:hypothetical protein